MAKMEVVAPHHSQIASGNSPICRLSVSVERLPEDCNAEEADLANSILETNALNHNLKLEEEADAAKTTNEEQNVEATIVNSGDAQSTLSENSCDGPAIKPDKPSESKLLPLIFDDKM